MGLVGRWWEVGEVLRGVMAAEGDWWLARGLEGWRVGVGVCGKCQKVLFNMRTLPYI